ncbi:type VII secretion target [Nocardia amikacinitolerans]|uniref:type VII secretion target n=1 Tax=Nocardia amikacinitolerans TaxID=756689 RepID=UPI0015C7A81B|nr:type VII secretion target [Nocardia amikacinitolerans]
MAVPDAISVDPDEVRKHAEVVTRLVTSLEKCLEAATYLGNADDGFGLIPRIPIALLFDDKQDNTVSVIHALAESVSEVPDKLKTVATTFEDKDGKLGQALTALRESIAEDKGGNS